MQKWQNLLVAYNVLLLSIPTSFLTFVFNFSEYSMHGVWLVEETIMKRMIYKQKKSSVFPFQLKNIVFLQ